MFEQTPSKTGFILASHPGSCENIRDRGQQQVFTKKRKGPREGSKTVQKLPLIKRGAYLVGGRSDLKHDFLVILAKI